MKILEKIFNGKEKVQIMRMFLFNPDVIYGLEEVVSRTGVSRRLVEKELVNLSKAELLKRKLFSKSVRKKFGKKRSGLGWVLNKNFPYLIPLSDLLIKQALISEPEIIRRLSHIARLKLLVIAGLFTGNVESRVDLLIVGDDLRKNVLTRIIKSFESEIGKEIRYAAFETQEFKYRMTMCDKLLRDIFDYSHKTILDRIHLFGDVEDTSEENFGSSTL